MTRAIGVVLTCGVFWLPAASSVVAGDLTDPTEILKKADDATKAIKAIKYSVTYKGSGAGDESIQAESTVTAIGKSDGGSPQKYVFDVKITRPGSAAPDRKTAGSDGENSYLIDYQSKKAYVDMDPQVIGSFGRAMRVVTMAEFLHPTPFSDEIKADKKDLLDSKTVAGEDCYQIRVVYDDTNEAVWCFSKKSFLPWQRQDKPRKEGQDIGRILTVTHLEVDPKLDGDVFAFKLPEGFEKTSDFAP